jgi:hypothetical protein
MVVPKLFLLFCSFCLLMLIPYAVTVNICTTFTFREVVAQLQQKEFFDEHNNLGGMGSPFLNTSNGFQLYEGRGFRIQYPSDWEAEETTRGYVVYFNPPDQGPPLTFHTGSAHNRTSQQYIEDEIMMEMNYQGPAHLDFPIELNPISIAGNPGSYAVFTYTKDGETEEIATKEIMAATIKDGKVYKFDFSSELSEFDSYLPTIRSIIDSFEITARDQTGGGGSNNFGFPNSIEGIQEQAIGQPHIDQEGEQECSEEEMEQENSDC